MNSCCTGLLDKSVEWEGRDMRASEFFDEFERRVKTVCDHFVVRNSACCGAKSSSYNLLMSADLRGREGFVAGEYDACGNVNLKIVPGRQDGMLDVYALSSKDGTIIVDVKHAELLN